MAHVRWLAPWKDSLTKPVIYHCISRVVERRFAFGKDEKEKLRTLMRMYEKFSGCRALAYCFMSNHIHLLLEVPPMPAEGLTDAELLQRLRAICSEVVVTGVAKELAEVRQQVKCGLADEVLVREIHDRYTYRMHSLSEYMKGFMQRFTQWFNRSQKRSGGLWEDAFKSVIVEDGCAARAMAAYIDLNPVRAGLATDPADYRWSSYGEAMGGGPRGNGKKARAGLVRALRAHQGYDADAQYWAGDVSREYRMLLLAEGAADVSMGKMLRCRVRYFTDGAVIGSRGFVDEVFHRCRNRFGPKRKSGARKLRGNGAAAAGVLWCARALQKQIGASP